MEKACTAAFKYELPHWHFDTQRGTFPCCVFVACAFVNALDEAAAHSLLRFLYICCSPCLCFGYRDKKGRQACVHRCLLFANKVQIERAISPSALMEMLDVRMRFSARDCLCVSLTPSFCFQCCWGERGGKRGMPSVKLENSSIPMATFFSSTIQ